MKKKSKIGRIILIAFLVFVAMIVIVAIVGPPASKNASATASTGTNGSAPASSGSSNTAPAEPTATPAPAASDAEAPAPGSDEALRGAYMLAELGVKQLYDSARNPDSLKFSEIFITRSHSVCYNYRAQNGFGGMNVEHAVLSSGGEFKHSNQTGFEKLWNQECVGSNGWTRTDQVLSLYKAAYGK